MKRNLLSVACILFTIVLHAQLNVWTGGGSDANWSNADNWSGNVPTNSEDVQIPTGFTVIVDTPVSIRSIDLEGNSILNVQQSIEFTNPSEFEMNTVVNWTSGDLNGGNVSGTLLNSGTINLSDASFDLAGSITVNNTGTINMIGNARIAINNNSVLNNSGTGTIDFQSNGTEITAAGLPPNVFNNFGLIKTSFSNSTDEGFISGQFINTNGVIQVEEGKLEMNTTSTNLNGGTLNVSPGAILELNGSTTVLGTLTGAVNGELKWRNDIVVDPATTAVFNFSGNRTILWEQGDLEGGGTLTNQSIIEKNVSNGFISGGTTLNNDDQIIFSGSADIFIATNSVLNNNATGIIEFQGNNSAILSSGATPHTFTNNGIVRCNQSMVSDQGTINVTFNNNDGAIEVNSGVLNLSNTNITLTDGQYDVASGATMNWVSSLAISGQLTGTLTGDLNWSNTVNVTGTAEFDFTTGSVINWNNGNLDGGGVLTNNNTIIKGTNSNGFIFGSTTLNNDGEIIISNTNDIFIGTGSVINNNASGLIDLQANFSGISTSGVAPNVLNNFGEIRGNASAGSAAMSVQISNSGIIDVVQNQLNLTGVITNEVAGIIKGTGTLTLPGNPANFTNNGTFAPGSSPGTLAVVNDFGSSTSAVLQLELNGLSQGIDYDLLTISGDADLDGGIDIVLGFSPSVNDEFIVLTTSGTINTCNVPATGNASFGGSTYDFDIACRNNDELVLTVTNETLGVDEEFEDEFKVFPNPVEAFFIIKTSLILDQVEVFDINGRVVKSFDAALNEYNVQDLSQGVYLIRIISGTNVTTKRLIKL